RSKRDWSSDVCSSDLAADVIELADHDRDAREILTRAAAHAAASLNAAAQGHVPPIMSAVGGLAHSDRFLRQIRSELAALRPDARSEERRVGKEGGYRC